MDDKTLDRVEKLVRLADSTGSDGERRSALSECVRVFDREVDAERASRRRRRPSEPPRARPPQPARSPDPEVVAAVRGRCALCGGAIERGDVVWLVGGLRPVHADACP